MKCQDVPSKIARRSLMASPFTAATSMSEDAWPPSSGHLVRRLWVVRCHAWGILNSKHGANTGIYEDFCQIPGVLRCFKMLRPTDVHTEQDGISSSKIHGILSSELRPVPSSGQTLSALLLPGSPLDQFGPVSDRFVGSVWLSDVLVWW